jgi:hypothetical protein
VAAEQLGRRCHAIEITPAFCDAAVRRWEEFTGKKAERVPANRNAESDSQPRPELTGDRPVSNADKKSRKKARA